METIKLTIENNGSKFTKTLELKTENDGLNLNQVFATCMKPFFKLVSMQSNGLVKLFKMNKPFEFTIEHKDIKVSTISIDSSLKTKFKLNKTAKSKRKFAQSVFSIMEWSLEKHDVITLEELVEKL